MDLKAHISYPAEPDQVAELLADPDYVAARCEATGAVESDVDVEHEDDGGFTVTTSRAFPTDGFPSFLRGVVGDALRIVQEDRWEPLGDGTWAGHTSVTTAGAPARVELRGRLEPVRGGSRQVVDGTIRAAIPLVGAKIEKLVHEQIVKAMRVEEQLASDWLTR